MVCLTVLINLPWPRCSLPVDKHLLLLGRRFLPTDEFENMVVFYNLERDLIKVWLYPSKFIETHYTWKLNYMHDVHIRGYYNFEFTPRVVVVAPICNVSL